MLTVEADSMISTDVEIRTGDSHSIVMDGSRINPARDVTIGERVWVGAGATILKGVRIGADSVVATKAVVTGGPFPPGSLIAGTPGRIVRNNVTWVRERLLPETELK